MAGPGRPGRLCTLCNHAKSALIDARLAAGEPIATLAADFRFSESAVYRHRSRHLSRTILREARASAQIGTADLVGRLSEALDDLTAARTAALLTGQGAQVIRAASAEVRAVEVLLDRLGIDSTEVARELREAEDLAHAVATAVRARPSLAQPIAAGLRARGHDEAADALDHLAATAVATTERTDA